jgi:hypothetical protein
MLVTIWQSREPHVAENKSIMATNVRTSYLSNIMFVVVRPIYPYSGSSVIRFALFNPLKTEFLLSNI